MDQITGPIQNCNASQTTPCRQCRRTNHETQNCLYLGALSAIKCDECSKFGHLAKRCWGKKGQKRNRPNKDTGHSANKKAKTDRTNAATEQSHATIEEVNDENASVNEAIVFVVEEGGIQFDESEIGQYSGFKEYAANGGANDKCVLYYDWLADSATTLHISNACKAFVSYQPANGTTVAGVGDMKTSVMGHGDVVLLSQCEGRTYELQLKNVLHIPSNRNNLLSLSRWEGNGRTYVGENNQLTLVNGSGNPVAKGTKIRNSLYKMDLVERWTEIQSATSNLSFATTQEKPSWETWHRRFGHVSYDGLRKLLRGNFVDGLNIDEDSPQPECVTCVESKMAEEPYRGLPKRQMNPGALTHIDVWGKYDVTSINGHQYYLLFVDDATCYITVNFLKRKDEASARVKDYIVHL